MIRHLLKATSFIALLPAMTLPLQVNAARNYENTWFEIEVILFSQIDDKSKLQEVFPDTSTLPTPDAVIDILTDYLDPNVASLKQHVASCPEFLGNNQGHNSTHTFAIQYPTFEQQIAKDKANNYYLFSNEESTRLLNIELEPESTFGEEQHPSQAENFSSSIENNTNSYETRLVEQSLDDGYEQEYQPVYSFNTPSLPQEFCVVPEAFFDDYKKEHPGFSYNGVPLKQVPNLITGEEDLTTDRPYFINEESLQLHDIFKQLRSSRNFRPLLHLGWRQITKGPREAIPLKLYAGENLIQPYYEDLNKYNQAIKNKLALEQNNQFFEEQSYDQFNAEQDAETALKEQIDTILQQARNIKPTAESVLMSLNTDPNDLVNPVSNEFITGEESEFNQVLIEPQKPPQTWTIEGFLKVEVEHYLHITADFNVINMSLADQATKQLVSKKPVKLKSIRFEQNKRVRSTEIHYFDHPYMGMIVQIRRHDQVPPVEDETAEEQLISEME